MSHPTLDDEITVPESSVPFWGAAGWSVVEDEPEQEQDQADDTESGGEKKSERPRATSAAKKKGDS